MSPDVPRALSAILLCATLLAFGCSRPAPTRGPSGDSSELLSPGGNRAGTVAAETRKAEFLNRIRSADPRQQTIERALLNEQNELGLVLTRQTDLAEVPKLMRTMLAELDRAFPGQDHTVIAYAPTTPPRTIGTARLNARTREMTYTPVAAP
jgi:hypothetical protein